jgi:DDE family transposase
LARLDRERKKKTSNTDWTSPSDPDAKVTTMKDGRTHLAHKGEHAVDLDTGAIIAVTVQGADEGDTTTIIETAVAAEQVEDAQAEVEEAQKLEDVIADKGYHSNQTTINLDALDIRSYEAPALCHAARQTICAWREVAPASGLVTVRRCSTATLACRAEDSEDPDSHALS